MFVVLDTNHYNELANDSAVGRNAQRQIKQSRAEVFISIISIQEAVQGWLALINKKKSGREQLHAYSRFQTCVETFGRLIILPFDEAAARIFDDLQRQRLRVGTMDLKIAAICLAHDALLLTRNLGRASGRERVTGCRSQVPRPRARERVAKGRVRDVGLKLIDAVRAELPIFCPWSPGRTERGDGTKSAVKKFQFSALCLLRIFAAKTTGFHLRIRRGYEFCRAFLNTQGATCRTDGIGPP